MGAARSAAARLGVPIVGGDGGDDMWNRDPNAFQSGGSFTPASAGGFVDAVRDTGFKKLGLIYCIEATPCVQMHKQFANDVAAAGGQDVFQQGVSLTQSDYTAECQNLKNAGAQIVGLFVDAASQQRFARSCVSIGYKPVLETGGLSVSPAVINDPNIQALTQYVGNINSPYKATGTPALDTLHQAFKTYTGADVPDQPSVIGWSAGMLFKGAIDSLDAATARSPISTAMVLDGLYGLKDKTLGGLAPPLKFTRGSGSGLIPCFTSFKITTKGIEVPGPTFKCMQWND
jgi:branched-chain amino acid transport system substrate-binding protein